MCESITNLTYEKLFFPEFPEIANGLHGSDSPDSAEREIEIVFPHILHGTDDDAGYNVMSDNMYLHYMKWKGNKNVW